MGKTLNIARALRKGDALAKKGEIAQAAKVYSTILEGFPNNVKAKRALRSLQPELAKKEPENDADGAENLTAKPMPRSLGDLSPFADPLDLKTIKSRTPPAPSHGSDMLSASSGGYQKSNLADQKDALDQVNKGLEQLERGRFESALEGFSKAARLNPELADAHLLRGSALNLLGLHGEALASIAKAIQLKPNSAETYFESGISAKSLGQFERAVSDLGKAIQLAPDFMKAHLLLAEVLHGLDQGEQALAEVAKAQKIDPDNADVYATHGLILLELGKTEEAADSLGIALKKNPEHFVALAHLGGIKRFTGSDREVVIAERALRKPDISTAEKSRIHFFLAQVSENAGNYAEAFAHLVEGNQLRKAHSIKSQIDYSKVYRRVKSNFAGPPPQLPIKDMIASQQTVRPIFIVGMLRSGTTLIEQILASHSAVYGGGELSTVSTLIESIGGEAARVDQDNLRFVREGYLAALGKMNTGAQFVTDKMPQNFVNLGFLIASMPDAKFIHTKRSAMATCWSCFKHNFGGEHAFSYSIESVAEYYKLYVEMMDFWQEKFPGKIYQLDYEKLTENQEEETRKLLAHIGLDWEDQCLEFHKTKRSVRTVSLRQVRQGLYKGSSEAWRKYEEFLDPMTDRLAGY